MKKLLMVFTFFFIFSYLPLAISYQPTALAIESTKSALESFREDLASRAADPIIKNEVAKKLQNKAYVGVVKSKNSTSITMLVKESNININITDFTEYLIKSKTYTGGDGQKNITAENTIAALGDIDDKGTLVTKRIIKLNTPVPSPKKIIYGIVTSITGETLTLKTNQNDQYLISFDKKDSIKINSRLIVVVVAEQPDGDKLFQAKFIYLFP